MEKQADIEEIETKKIKTCLGNLAVRISGKGESIIFWHSLMFDGTMWQAQEKFFSQNYQVILVDAPGHGNSEQVSEMFTMEECSLCVVQILDALNVDKAYFVGNSWGGMMGGPLAALYPDRISGAVLMNCTASSASSKQRFEFRLLSRITKTFNRVPGFILPTALKAYVGPTATKEKPDVVEKIKSWLKNRKGHGESSFYALRSVVSERRDYSHLLNSIRIPVMIVSGEEDRTFPVPHGESMANAIPGSKFLVMAKTGHLAAIERPDEVNELIKSFISS